MNGGAEPQRGQLDRSALRSRGGVGLGDLARFSRGSSSGCHRMMWGPAAPRTPNPYRKENGWATRTAARSAARRSSSPRSQGSTSRVNTPRRASEKAENHRPA